MLAREQCIFRWSIDGAKGKGWKLDQPTASVSPADTIAWRSFRDTWAGNSFNTNKVVISILDDFDFTQIVGPSVFKESIEDCLGDFTSSRSLIEEFLCGLVVAILFVLEFVSLLAKVRAVPVVVDAVAFIFGTSASLTKDRGWKSTYGTPLSDGSHGGDVGAA